MSPSNNKDQNSAVDNTKPRLNREEEALRKRFGELVLVHQSRIRTYIRSLGVAESSVDDIAQAAFAMAFERFPSFEEDTSFCNWVGTIARHLVWNDGRKKRRRLKILNENVTEFFAAQDAFVPVEEREDDSIQREALKECIETLPEKNRKLIMSRYYKGLEPKEIAGEFNINEDSIRKMLYRVRQALRDCIEAKVNKGKELQ